MAHLDQADERGQNRLYTTKQAAEYLSLGLSTLTRWRHEGVGPEFEKLGSAVRYSQRSLDEYRKACQRQSTSEYTA